MSIKTCSILLIFFCLGSSRLQTKITESMYYETPSLLSIANHYLNLLNKIGNPLDPCDPQEILQVCAQNCKKIRNGKTLFENKEHFTDQLILAKEWLGGWSIQPLELLLVQNPHSVVIRYLLTTEKEGQILVFVILKFDDSFYIYEINEVHEPIPVKSFSRIFGSFEPSFRFILGGLYHTPYTTRPK